MTLKKCHRVGKNSEAYAHPAVGYKKLRASKLSTVLTVTTGIASGIETGHM